MSLRRIVTGLLAGAVALVWAATATASPSGVVISQVYGGGGNTGSPLTHDYVELYNAGSTTVSLAGWSVQYASATGTGNLGASSTQLTELSGSIAPGRYLLIQEAAGAGNGVALPTPDIVDASPIAMAAGAGKVALVRQATTLGCNGGSAPCSPAQLALIEDLVGYGNANFFEGSGAAPTLSNTTAALRAGNGASDPDNNAGDFAAGAPNPRNSTFGQETAPSVSSTTPAAGAVGVALDANVSITFSEDVSVSGSWFSITCATSGAHTAAASGGPSTFTLDPDTDFAEGESCTVTVVGSQVADVDLDDPPDTMAADASFSFTTFEPPPTVAEIQGAGHVSPYVNTAVSGVEGIVTARRGGGQGGLWIQDPSPDANPLTAEGIFVRFGGFPPSALAVGMRISVAGIVREFRGGSDQLAVTRIEGPTAVVVSGPHALPAPLVLGTSGLTPPTENIDDDSNGDVETSPTHVFDPADDAIDFYEALEGMRVRANPGTVVMPTRSFGEIVLLPDDIGATGMRTIRGGILYSYADPNPERITIDDEIVFGRMPAADVGDRVTAPVIGPIDYSFDNFKIQAETVPVIERMGLEREVANTTRDQELAVATFNVENLTVGNPQAKFDELASMIVDNLRSPDLIAIEEVQDDSGAANDGTVDATQTWEKLVAAIEVAGGPAYQWRSINPLNNEDGGAPGANIRVGFLFHTDRDLKFIDRPGGGPATETTVVQTPSGPQLSASPGRIGTQSPAFDETRKSLVGEFKFRGKTLFFVANHLSSKGDDEPLFGRFQPPTRHSEVARHGQAAVVNAFVDQLLSADPNAFVVVAGDINDFEFSETVSILEGGVMQTFMDTLPANERYSYVFEGNSQTLDQILGTLNVVNRLVEYDVVHVNAEFADQASDHDPSVARINLIGRP